MRNNRRKGHKWTDFALDATARSRNKKMFSVFYGPTNIN